MQQIIITLTSANGTIARKVLAKPEGKPVQLQVPEGVKVDVQVQGPVQGKSAEQPNVKHDLQLKQVGKDLVIEGEGEKLVEVTDFYATPSASVGSVGWDYAELVATDVAVTSVEGKSAGQGGEAMASADAESFFAGYSMPVVLGGAAVGAAVLAAGSGSGSVAAAGISNIVTGSFTAGPSVTGNNLKVQLYKADKSKLGDPVSLDANGKFSVDVGSYTGAVLIQLVGKGDGADYRDEATNMDMDLTTDLVAMGTVGAGTTTINVNPLTTMAAKVAGVTSANGGLQGAYDAAKAATANTDVAKAFGLTGDVTKLDATPVIKADGTVNTTASELGKVLAALSGVDAKTGGLQATIDAYVPTAGAVISNTALNNIKTDLIEGAAATQAKLGTTDLVKAVATVLAAGSSTAGYSMDAIATDDVIDATEAALFTSTSTLTFKVPTGKLPADLEVWLPSASAKGTGTIAIANGVATYTLGAGEDAVLNALSDGVARFQVKASGGSASAAALAERLVMVGKVDDAPTKVTLINTVASLAELAGAATTTADIKVADIVVADRDGGTNALGLTGADAALFAIIDNSLYLKAGAALNFEGGKSSFQVAVTATGGATSAVVTGTSQTLTLTNINEAPTVANAIADTAFVVGGAVDTYTIPANTFADVDANTTLTYSAKLADGSALPSWLTFDAATRTFSGNPSADGTVTVRVTASDGALTVFDDFALTSVTAPVVQSFSVTDGTASNGSTLGKFDEALTFVVKLSEAVTTTAGLTAVFTVNGTDVTATATAVTGSDTVTFTGAKVPSTGNGTAISLKSLVADSGAIQGDVSKQPMVAVSAGAIVYAAYTVDNTEPTVTSTTFSVDENATAFKTSGALAANETVTWAFGTGDDTDLFSLTNGVLSLKAAKNYEASADNSAAGTHAYKVNVVATDTAGNATTQAITVNLNDVNEAPTVANAIADTAFVVGGAVDTYTIPANTFADVDANTTLTYSAKLADGSALPSWLTFDAATRTFSGNPSADGTVTVRVTASDGALTVFDDFVLSSVSAPSLSTQLNSAVTNFDVRSKIVFSVGETVTANVGGKITLTDLGGAGFRLEGTTHTQEIDITDTSRVQIVGTGANTKIIIDPLHDLDLASNYSLSVSTGAFHGATSGQDSVAFATVNFSTVAPGAGLAAAVQARSMNVSTGELQNSLKWFDASNIGDATGFVSPPTDLEMGVGTGNSNYAVTFKEIDPTTSTLEGQGAVNLLNFDANDLVYVDNQNFTFTNVQEAWAGAIFAGGKGTSADPFQMSVGGDGTAGSYVINFILAQSALDALPATLSDTTLSTVLSSNWSNTGMVIAA